MGEISVAAPGGTGLLTVKDIPLLHGPLPLLFRVMIHHCPAPGASEVVDVTEQVPVPLGQPAAEAVYHWVIFLLPELSFTNRK